MIAMTVADLGAPTGSPGGQGSVFEHPHDPTLLVKRYHGHVPVDSGGLQALVDWRPSLPVADRRVLDAQSAWPTEVVDFQDGTFGVLIPRAPSAFFHLVGGDRLPRVLSWAFDVDACRFAGVKPASPVQAVRLAQGAAQVFDVLHRHGVAYRDVSGNNMFFSHGSRPVPYLIDCDGAHVLGAAEGIPGGTSPNWGCPWGGSATQEDLYKLSLLVLRVVFRYQGPIDTSVGRIRVSGLPRQGVSREMVDHLSAGLSQGGSRPTPADWMTVLADYESGLMSRGAA